jgi:formylglycine-generating enzyme
MKHSFFTTSCFVVLCAVSASAAINIDYVSVGNPGNAADPATGSLYGAVAHEYNIAKNETTIANYATFLNAVAQTDTYGLYSTFMETNANIAGIQRIGTSGDYSYTVIGSGNRPITYVSWFDAARFANWLHNGQPSGAQTASTTEDGAYTLAGAISGVGISKNLGASVWIPSEDEWYKAAYYDPNKDGPGMGGYWAQATQSDTITSNTVGVAGAANHIDSTNAYAVTQSTSYSFSQNYLTDVGAYGLNSDSAYGTNDQAGNVWEWNDAVIGASRGVRSGSWDWDSSTPPASIRIFNDPQIEGHDTGFRTASIPEPSALLLALLSAGALLTGRRRSSP